MSLLNQVIKGKQRPPVLALIYGPAGVGKTTLGAGAPNPIFLGTESGTHFIDVSRFPAPKTFDDVTAAVDTLKKEKHGYETLVIDSLDWLEPLVWSKVVSDGKVKTIEDFGYGKGYVLALKVWQDFIKNLAELREEKKLNILLLAHSHVKPYNDPKTNSSYDRYIMKLHDKAGGLFKEFVDAILFNTYSVETAKDKMGKDRAYGDGNRVLYTQYRPSFDAKNRMGLPFEIKLPETINDPKEVWTAFYKYYDMAFSEDIKSVKASIAMMMEKLSDKDVFARADKAFVDAGDDAVKLSVIKNRLIALTGSGG